MPPGGQLEAPGLAPDGPGKGPFFVAEQLRGQQGFRVGRAVDHHQGALGALAETVDHLGQQAFARAGFAFHEHRGVGGHYLVQHVGQLLDLGGAAHHLGQVALHLQGALGLLPAETGVGQLFIQVADAQHHPHPADQGFHVHRLGEEILGPQVQGLQEVVLVAQRGQNHHRHVAQLAVGLDGLEHLPAAHARQEQVQEDEVEVRGIGQPGQGFLPGGAGCLLETLRFHQGGEKTRGIGIILNDEDASIGFDSGQYRVAQDFFLWGPPPPGAISGRFGAGKAGNPLGSRIIPY